MSVYSYPQSKIIDQVTVHKSDGGHVRAYLRAASGANPAVLRQAMQSFCGRGWQCTPYSMNGAPVLEVQGMRSGNQLRSWLEEHGWAQGGAITLSEGKDDVSFGDKLRKRSLAASGLFYLVGDSAFTRYGYEGGSKLNTAAGLFYGAGTLSLLGFGRKDQSDLQVRDLAKKMSEYMQTKGANLPQNCSIDSIVNDHKKGLLKSADDLFRRYPSEMMNVFFTAAGVCIAIAAKGHMNESVKPSSLAEVIARKEREGSTLSKAVIEEKMNKYHKLEGKLDIGLGAMTGLSGLFAVLVREKHPDPDAPPKHGAAALWQKIQQKPLAIAGVGYMVSTMCHATSTAMAWKYADDSRRKSVKWRAVFVGANIVAEILLAMSSKGHGQGVKSDKSVDHTVIALAADLIARQPAKMQDALIDHVAGFLGHPDVLAIRNEDAKRMLHEQVAVMRKNPWALANQSPSQQQTAPVAAVPDPASAWQTRVAKESPSAQPQLTT